MDNRTPKEIKVARVEAQRRPEREDQINIGKYDFVGSINPPPLEGTAAFHISAIVMNLLNQIELFEGRSLEGPNKFLGNIIGVCSALTFLGINYDGILLGCSHSPSMIRLQIGFVNYHWD